MMSKIQKPGHLSLTFGAMAPPIHEQLAEQGFEASEKDLEKYQNMAHALAMVRIHGLVPESTARAGEKRLLKKIIKEVLNG